jgi:hypothetical protein
MFVQAIPGKPDPLLLEGEANVMGEGTPATGQTPFNEVGSKRARVSVPYIFHFCRVEMIKKFTRSEGKYG